MTQNTSNPTTRVPQGQLLQILIAGGADGELLYNAKWFRALDEQQKYAVVEACDRLLRTLSPRYRENVARIDDAAKLGFELRAKPHLLRFVMSLSRLRAWKDADHDDSAPTD